MPAPKPNPKRPSLEDFLVRYDLPSLLREAKEDLGESVAGAPRLLAQKDIAARFRKPPRPTPPPAP